jgi:hypothetical protein
MTYQTALTIVEVTNDIHREKYLLAGIQLEFVWLANHTFKKIFFLQIQ